MRAYSGRVKLIDPLCGKNENLGSRGPNVHEHRPLSWTEGRCLYTCLPRSFRADRNANRRPAVENDTRRKDFAAGEPIASDSAIAGLRVRLEERSSARDRG